MELPILIVTRDENQEASFDLKNVADDFTDLPSGDYALVKIQSLSDRMAVEGFI